MIEQEIPSLNNNVVTKSNVLIEANYKLGVREQKIILFLVSKIRKDDDDFKMYSLPIKDFCELMGYTGTPKYSEIRKITKDLIGKVLEIREGNKLMQMSWLSYVEYKENENDGSVSLSFDPRLKPYLLQLKREFTSYKLKNVMELKSSYSIRIYEILKKWQTIKKVEIPLVELRKMVGATDKYDEYHNFKKRILKPSQEEVGEKTDISFDYHEIKKGRKVDAIRFVIYSNKTVMAPEKDDWFESLYDQLVIIFHKNNYTLSSNVVKRWISLAEKIWGNNKYIEVNKLVQQSMPLIHIQNHIAFITYILNEKVACIENGTDPHKVNIETASKITIRKEMLPDWFDEHENQGRIISAESDNPLENKSVDELLKMLKDR